MRLIRCAAPFLLVALVAGTALLATRRSPPAASASAPEGDAAARASPEESIARRPPPVPRAGTSFVTGRLTELGGYPINGAHLIYVRLRVREAAEAPVSREDQRWSYPEKGGIFGIEAPAGPRNAELLLDAVYLVDVEDPEGVCYLAEAVVPFRFESASVVDLGDVPLPGHPALSFYEGEVLSSAGAPPIIRFLHLEGSSRHGRPIRLARHVAINHAPNAPVGHHMGARFAVGLLPEGDYALWIGAEGHETGRTSITVRAGQEQSGVRLLLQPSRMELKGVVLDAATGLPVPGAEVRAAEKDPEPGRQEKLFWSSDESGSDGSFTVKLAGLPSCGTFVVTAWREGYGTARIEVPVAEFSTSSSVFRSLRLPLRDPQK